MTELRRWARALGGLAVAGLLCGCTVTGDIHLGADEIGVDVTVDERVDPEIGVQLCTQEFLGGDGVTLTLLADEREFRRCRITGVVTPSRTGAFGEGPLASIARSVVLWTPEHLLVAMPGQFIPTHGDPLTQVDIRLRTGLDVVATGPGGTVRDGVVHLTSAADLQQHGVFVVARRPALLGLPAWLTPASVGLVAGGGAALGVVAWRRRAAGTPAADPERDTSGADRDPSGATHPAGEPDGDALQADWTDAPPPEDPRVWAGP